MEANMAERTMTPQEVGAYLNEVQIANMATLRRDGSPHLAPIWYEYDGEKLYITTGSSSVKVRNIKRDPRVMVSVAVPEEPYRYVLIEGRAEVTTTDVEKTTLSVCVRYQGQERGSNFAREILESGEAAVVVVHPTRIISWMDEGSG
jgi:PPOX class probable F420-dependent enzyme